MLDFFLVVLSEEATECFDLLNELYSFFFFFFFFFLVFIVREVTLEELYPLLLLLLLLNTCFLLFFAAFPLDFFFFFTLTGDTFIKSSDSAKEILLIKDDLKSLNLLIFSLILSSLSCDDVIVFDYFIENIDGSLLILLVF